MSPEYSQTYCETCREVTTHESRYPEKPESLGPKQARWFCTVCGSQKRK